jgi:uncharacterized protein
VTAKPPIVRRGAPLPRDLKLRGRLQDGKFVPTADSFVNFANRLGIGAGNINSAATYNFNPITRNRIRMDWAYRGSWVCGVVVDCVAEDMTREGVDFVSSDAPNKLMQFDIETIQPTGTWPALLDTIKWGRLYGGSGGLIMIEGQDTKDPFDPRDVGRDQYKGVLPLDRWSLWPTLDHLVQEWGPDIGKPMWYDLTPDYGTGLPYMRIHHSRLLRLEGVKLPYWQAITENLWGMSVIERLWDRLVAFDSATTGAAQLVYKAHLRTYAVEGLRKIIALGGKEFDGLIAQVEAIRRFQSSEGLTLIDAKDTFAVHPYGFEGLDDVLLQFGQQLAGAAQIPLTRLFGQSPAGLNATGESDLRMYYDNIRRQQVNQFSRPLRVIYHSAYRSQFGADPPRDWHLDFKPLWLLTEAEKAQIAGTLTDAALGGYEKGLLSREQTLKELKEQSKITGAFSNITDDDINQAAGDDKEERAAEVDAPTPRELLEAKQQPPKLSVVK